MWYVKPTILIFLEVTPEELTPESLTHKSLTLQSIYRILTDSYLSLLIHSLAASYSQAWSWRWGTPRGKGHARRCLLIRHRPRRIWNLRPQTMEIRSCLGSTTSAHRSRTVSTLVYKIYLLESIFFPLGKENSKKSFHYMNGISNSYCSEHFNDSGHNIS